MHAVRGVFLIWRRDNSPLICFYFKESLLTFLIYLSPLNRYFSHEFRKAPMLFSRHLYVIRKRWDVIDRFNCATLPSLALYSLAYILLPPFLKYLQRSPIIISLDNISIRSHSPYKSLEYFYIVQNTTVRLEVQYYPKLKSKVQKVSLPLASGSECNVCTEIDEIFELYLWECTTYHQI